MKTFIVSKEKWDSKRRELVYVVKEKTVSAENNLQALKTVSPETKSFRKLKRYDSNSVDRFSNNGSTLVFTIKEI